MADQFRVQGVVASTYTKEKQTRFGPKNLNYCTMDDGRVISTGFKSVFNKGQAIDCVVEFKFQEYQLAEGQSPVAGMPDMPSGAAGAPQGGAKATGGGAPRGRGSFPVQATDGQMSIIRQNSMNRAVEILDQWQDNNLFKPTSESEYLSKLIEVALTITDFNSGQDIMKLMDKQTMLKAAQEAA